MLVEEETPGWIKQQDHLLGMEVSPSPAEEG